MNVIGLTGMTGAGKSRASHIFAEFNYTVINCDELAKKTVEKIKCRDEIKRSFPEFYDGRNSPAGDIFNRKTAAKVLFSSVVKMTQYEKIVYPYITYELIKLIGKNRENNILIDAPALYQSGTDGLCRKIIAVVASPEICVKRITERDSISDEDAFLRLNAQPKADFFKEKADYFIENNSSIDKFTKKITEIITGLNNESKKI